MKSLRWSIAANFVGRAWTLIMGAVFVPIYLNLLGVEAYGLIGFFLSLQSVLGIVDLGLSLTLNRELARSQGSLRSSAAMVRTLETVYWSASVGVGAMLIACGGWIARNWVQTVSLPVETVTESVRAMGLIFSLQAPFALYQGGLVGLQKQVLANAVLIFTVAIRFGGAALALWLISPTLRTYFSWHIASAIVSTGLCAWALWRFIPGRFWLARAEPRVLRDIWKFSMTVAANSVVGISLTQLDKIMLSRLLDLVQFGYYALASLVASALWAVILPINTALFPRLTQLHERKDNAGLAALYHKGCQLMSIVLFPIAFTLIVFSEEVMSIWTRDSVTAEKAHAVAAMLLLGTTLNGIASVSTYLQSACGWPGLLLRTNVIQALLIIPALLLVVPRYGTVGAAALWVLLNATYVFVTIPIMHSRLLKGEFSHWITKDVLLPACPCLTVLLGARLLFPGGALGGIHVAFLAAALIISFLACAWSVPEGRRMISAAVAAKFPRLPSR